MSLPVLHHIYDPLCGWCYAAAPLVAVARSVPGLALALHGGGMMAGNGRQRVTPQLRSYVLPHDQRIAQLTGQVFGDAYRDGLLLNTEAMLDSAPPIAAILAAEQVAGRGADMLEALQRAHYVEGQVIAERATLLSVAEGLGLDRQMFSEALTAQMNGPVDAHIDESRRLLRQVGGAGFPTIVLETAAGRHLLEMSRYLGKPGQWRQALLALLA